MSPLPNLANGERPHKVTFQNPGEPVPDGQGGYTEGWTDLDPPSMFVQIRPASVADLERVASGTVTSSATHLVTGPFHPGVTTKTRVTFTDRSGRARELAVAGIVNPEERNIEMILLCEESVE